MTESMIERVERCIMNTPGWRGTRVHAKHVARAAIKAMREPTEAMLTATNWGEMFEGRNPQETAFRFLKVWQAMIDEALQDGQDDG